MSYILNALKHSESQRNRGEIPHIDSQPEFGKVPSRKWTDHLWKWLGPGRPGRHPPAPAVPAEVAQKTADKYREALTRLTA